MVSQAAQVYFRLLPELIAKRRWVSILVLTSHKLLRWLTAPLLAIAVIATVPLAGSGETFRIALGLEILFALAAAIGLIATPARHRGQGDLRLPVYCAELRAGGRAVAMFFRGSSGGLETEKSLGRGTG